MISNLLNNNKYFFDGLGYRQRGRKIFGIKITTLKSVALILFFFLVIAFCGRGTFPY